MRITTKKLFYGLEVFLRLYCISNSPYKLKTTQDTAPLAEKVPTIQLCTKADIQCFVLTEKVPSVRMLLSVVAIKFAF
jgi:hypothetical protein